ncbi:MAG: hypothetical protein A4E27_00721 [Methanobacterium sp. PtaU1.Bin242]|nr:MAG: hypothetical protein A4E27_00721 [Methanobacterium sp. PtaU1.Bin242]
MPLIAENHFQLIIEVAIMMVLGIAFILNIIPLSLTAVLLAALVISVGITALFGFDILSLFIGLNTHEFTHPYGSIALLGVVTGLAAMYIMDDVGIDTRSLKSFMIILIIFITIFGGMMHRDFLAMWLLGLLLGFFIISKSFRRKSVLTIRRMLMVFVVIMVSFGFMELVSRLLNMPIISPLMRVERIFENSIPSVTMVIKNTFLIGHNPATSFWGSESTGFADGYISLPIQLILAFGLPFPIFYGILTNQKDVIDYFTPGILGFSYDFGFLTLFLILVCTLAIFIIGLKILSTYKEKREKGNKNMLGREALLIGSLTAFISQAWVGFFVINRDINGTALVTFIFLGAMVLGHLLMIKKN